MRLHHTPRSTHLRDVPIGNRPRSMPDSCQSLSQFRLDQSGNPVKVLLDDPLKARDQPLGFAEVVVILFSGGCRLLCRIGLAPALNPLLASKLGSLTASWVQR